MRKCKLLWGAVAVAIIGFAMFLIFLLNTGTKEERESSTEALATNIDKVEEAKPQGNTSGGMKELEDLIALYKDMPLADAHNHNAGGSKYKYMEGIWEGSGVDRVVLFGNISEPAAVATDEIAWEAFQENPEQYIPFFSGVNLLDESGLVTVKENLERGFFGLGEIAAASSYSESVKNVAWKTQDPMDGILPQIYELCAQYQAPILLHIDPPNGVVIDKLAEAATAYPKTNFIFAHANAYNSPENIEALLENHPNIYMDFFAGFTAFNPESSNKLEDFVPLIKKYPDRFLLSTDSGYGLKNEAEALRAMYLMIDLLGDTKEARMIAYDNLDALISVQSATATQLAAISQQDARDGTTHVLEGLSKLEAGKILAQGKNK